jgi:Astacin (Peptidase family M12A)
VSSPTSSIGPGCFTQRTVTHEFGHALGLFHEHQRADRDSFLEVDFANVRAGAESNFRTLSTLPTVGEYDFASVMHYRANTFAADTSRPTLIPLEPYRQFAAVMGTLLEPSVRDHQVLDLVYNAKLRDNSIRTPTVTPQMRFDRAEFLVVLEWLNAFYASRYGLQCPNGLSLEGRPDFVGIAQWIFGSYLPARASGFDITPTFHLVIAEITASEEWRQKNPTPQPLTRINFAPRLTFPADEYSRRCFSSIASTPLRTSCNGRVDCRLAADRTFSGSRRGFSTST